MAAMKTLQLNASLFSENGQSTRLADEFLKSRNADVVVRDLARNPVPHLSAERFQAFLAKPVERTPAQKAVVAESDALIDELRRADTIVIGLPMYNFGIPSTLKAYFDHIARAGETFKYTDKGAVGLLTGKKAYVFTARGGLYGEGHQSEAYMREFLRFVGIGDVEFVYAEGLAISPAAKEAAIAKARGAIERLNERDLAAI